MKKSTCFGILYAQRHPAIAVCFDAVTLTGSADFVLGVTGTNGSGGNTALDPISSLTSIDWNSAEVFAPAQTISTPFPKHDHHRIDLDLPRWS